MAAEAKAWKVIYGRNMNTKYQGLMEKILEQIDDLSKRLSRPIKDLDDVRQAMAALKDLRENEIHIDSSLGPIEVPTACPTLYLLWKVNCMPTLLCRNAMVCCLSSRFTWPGRRWRGWTQSATPGRSYLLLR